MRRTVFATLLAILLFVAVCLYLGVWVKRRQAATHEERELHERHGGRRVCRRNAVLQHVNPIYALGNRRIMYGKLNFSECVRLFSNGNSKLKNITIQAVKA